MNLLVIGDSWADCLWPALLGIPIQYRQAVAGSTAAQWASDFGGRLVRAINTDAPACLVSLLGNDVIAAMQDGTVSPDEIEAGCNSLSRVIASVAKRKTVVLLYADPFSGSDERVACAVALLNAAIIGCITIEATILDLRKVLGAEHFDGRDIHPNHAGQYAIAKAVEGLVNDI